MDRKFKPQDNFSNECGDINKRHLLEQRVGRVNSCQVD